MDQELVKTLWATADKLRNNMDAAEYKHVVLGLIFLKYISDSFEDLYNQLKDDKLSDEEDKDEYLAENVFYVPPSARWSYIQHQRAKLPSIGKDIDDAMDAIEKDNPSLKGVLPKDYARPALDKKRLGELVDLIGNIGFKEKGHSSKDLLGRVYEYFLGMFADAEGKRGGQFYTPDSIVKLLVEMLEPYNGRIYDGCCGSGGMFVQSEKFLEAHGGKIGDIAVYGQESNPTTYKLAKMNLAIRGIDAKIELGDTFQNDRHKDLKADFIMANPPFNISDWGGEQLQDSHMWKYGVPPVGNANYAWLQLFVNKLKPTGTAGIVLANGSMTTTAGSEGEIRKQMITEGLVDCMVALPTQLFFNTQIPACLWFLARNRTNHKFRDRSGEILFIDARKIGHMTSRKNKAFNDADIAQIANAYHNWRNKDGNYEDIQGFCKSATLAEVEANNFVLTPGRYVGTEEVEDDGIPYEEKVAAISENLKAYFGKSVELQERIKHNLLKVGIEL
ncbi:class I SAM-dependent DNA methyltransferase [Chryseobacterium taklimakanense]|uniref:site-specific DNA-methyltransferase (adenine-specific) n=1 Tax=Chryseobacterium taklimakanense TaxID=536441 RepID=A0A3G8WGX0_9FLAO|nr:class I SAM-dependent DNA methyltransferase [Chryseobacterium taklimakanense]AZI20442.1 SAM-dependent DNA methyltransferase [Chryseobacterium taklimakanense]